MQMGLSAQMIELPSILKKRELPEDVRALCYNKTKSDY